MCDDKKLVQTSCCKKKGLDFLLNLMIMSSEKYKMENIMHKRIKFFIFTLLIMVITGDLFSKGSAWKSVLNKKGIKVYTRPFKGSSMDEFKGVAVINAPIEVVVNVIRDANNQKKWMANCSKSKIIKRINKNHIVVYNILNVPWPLSDRDIIIDTYLTEDLKNGKFLAKMKIYKKSIVPVNKKYVRITKFWASCSLKRIGPNKTHLIYMNKADPAAPVPKAIANMMAKNNPYNTILGMRRMVKLKKYQIPKP